MTLLRAAATSPGAGSSETATRAAGTGAVMSGCSTGTPGSTGISVPAGPAWATACCAPAGDDAASGRKGRCGLRRGRRFLVIENSAKIRSLVIGAPIVWQRGARSEEHTSELQSLMRISYAVFCLKKKKTQKPIKQSE